MKSVAFDLFTSDSYTQVRIEATTIIIHGITRTRLIVSVFDVNAALPLDERAGWVEAGWFFIRWVERATHTRAGIFEFACVCVYECVCETRVPIFG